MQNKRKPLFTVPLARLCFFVLTFFPFRPRAQQEDFTGTYYLRDVMEAASGFRLNNDSTFEFFFSYGALDRYGSGRWKTSGDNVVLNSRPYPGADFALVKSFKDNQPVVTVKLDEKNSDLFPFVYCVVKNKSAATQYRFNEEGIITFPAQPIDSLLLYVEFCGEKISRFPATLAYNRFTFRFEPWLMEVFFKDFSLRRTANGLAGEHPLLTKRSYVYEKQ